MSRFDTKEIIHKTREDYNRIAKHFADTRQGAGELEKFIPLIKNDQYILDWGCGNGRLLRILRNKLVHYYGVDQSEKLLQIAKKEYVQQIKKGNVKFFSNAKKEVKFRPQFFDLVFMVASFHHLPDTASRLKLLQEVYSQMKNGARLIITVWNLESNWAQDKLKKDKSDWEIFGDNDYIVPWKNQDGELIVKRYYHYFTKKELKGLLVKAGFTIEDMYYSKGNERVPQKEARNLVAIAQK